MVHNQEPESLMASPSPLMTMTTTLLDAVQHTSSTSLAFYVSKIKNSSWR